MMSPYKFLKKPGGDNFFKKEMAKIKQAQKSVESTAVDPSHNMNLNSHQLLIISSSPNLSSTFNNSQILELRDNISLPMLHQNQLTLNTSV